MRLRWNAERLTTPLLRSKLLSIGQAAQRIEYLDVSNNAIESITDELGLLLPSLVELRLAQNVLADLSGVRHMKKLKSLSAACNRLEELPSLADLPHLTRLVLNDNLLTSLQRSAMSPLTLPKLEFLALERNARLPVHLARYADGLAPTQALLEAIAVHYADPLHGVPFVARGASTAARN